MNTIREKIILAIITKLAEITTAKFYNVPFGANIFRCRQNVDPSELPCVVVWPMPEEITKTEYGKSKHVMPVKIEGIIEFGTDNASVIAEQALGDIIEATTGIKWTLPYTSGGTYEIKAGDTITGDKSKATALVVDVTIASGMCSAGDAAGNLILRRLNKEFQSENINVGTTLNVATVTGAMTGESPVTSTTGDYANSISCTSCGIDSYPEEGHLTVGAAVTLSIEYDTNQGDPYNAE